MADTGPVARPRPQVLVAVALVALTLLAVWLRFPALAPGSLWLDDAWVALVGRAGSLADVGRVVVTAPLHTLLVAVALAPGDGVSEVAAQLPAWLAAVAGPVVAYLALRRVAATRAGAVAAAAVIAVAPVHVLYATRVKPYTIDALLTVVLLTLAVAVLDAPDRRRWVRLVAVALLSTLASSVLAIVSAGAVGAPALRGILAGGERRRSASVALAAYAGGALLWWLVVLRRTVGPGLTAFWADHFVPLDDLDVARRVIVDGGRAILTAVSPLPAVVTGVLILVVAGAVALRSRWYALLLVTPIATALALAVLRQVPWGGGRTDTYLVGLVAVAVALAFGRAGSVPGATVRAGPWVGPWVGPGVAGPAVAGLAVAVLAVAGATGERPGYPEHDVRAFVEVVDATAAPGEPVVVYPATRWAFALYTHRPVTLVDDPRTANGFEPRIEDAQVSVLPPLRDRPEAYLAHLEAATAGADRVWFVASHWAGDLAVLRAQFDGLGFSAADVDERRGALLVEYVRR